MATPATNADAIRWKDTTPTEFASLAVVGTVPGVAPVAVAGLSGPGEGRLRMSGAGSVQWRAPGSSTYGALVDVSAGGSFLLEDGDDIDHWLRVEVDDGRLTAGASAAVHLADVHGTPLAIDDVTAAEASAGNVETSEVVMDNDSGLTCSGIVVWIDPSVSGLEIATSSGGPWVSPTTEGAGLSLGNLTAGTQKSVHIRRTIGASTPSDPEVLHWIHASYTYSAVKRYTDCRGFFRIFNTAEYRFYRSNSGPPAESDPPFDTSAALPHEPTDIYADGTWYLSMSYFNGCIDSGFRTVGVNGETYLRLDLSGGAEIDSPPRGPIHWNLEHTAAGVVRVIGFYHEVGDTRADSWSIGVTNTGIDPVEDVTTIPVTMPTSGPAILQYDLPAQSHGTDLRVRLQTLRGSTYSEDSVVKQLTIDSTAPDAPDAGVGWVGGLPEGGV